MKTSARSPRESVFATAASIAPEPDAVSTRTSPCVRRKSCSARVRAASKAANSGPRWLIIGRADAARTVWGTNVGPGMRRFWGRYTGDFSSAGCSTHDASVKLAPSILNADFAQLGTAVRAVEQAGADWVHVDVMDGHFVPNLTFGPKMVADLHKATRLPLDVHLMIERPEEWVDRYVEAGAAYVVVHLEATRDVRGTLARIRQRGARAGLALNPETPVEAVLPYLGDLDLVLVMSVRP